MENVKGMLTVANQVVEDYKSIRIKKDGKVYTYDVSYLLCVVLPMVEYIPMQIGGYNVDSLHMPFRFHEKELLA